MKFIHTLRRVFSDKGLLLTLVLSITLLCVFYGKLLLHPSKTYFGSSGDGLQVYYETLYHTKYDTEYWHQQSINYPYGESIFFTSAMPMVNNLVKIFGPSADTAGVGLVNLLMLFSIVGGAIFLYAIFKHLRLPWFYGALSATAIAFFSPQIMRMTGHYSLSWVFFIPAMIYLLMRFYDQPSVRKSWAIAALALLAATTHLYFFAFFAAIAGIYWAALFISRDRGFGRFLFALKHFSIQLLVPIVLLQLLMMLSHSVDDRTHVPWGYLIFHSNTSGVFFPWGKFYEPLFNLIAQRELVEFEGIAYIGLTALLGLAVVIIAQIYTLFKKRFRKILSVTDNKPLNIFFWTSLFLLYLSFGRPFINGHEGWLAYLGPLRQFRAIGRFAWVFYYVVNIVAVYRLYTISKQTNWLRYTILVFVPALLFTDMIPSTIYADIAGKMNNRIPVLEDERNEMEANAWLRNFNPEKYQAILPLPFYHIGSENLSRVPADPEIINQSYIVSLKTGLPIMAVSSSRTSLSQTANLLSLVMDPSQPMKVLSDLPDKRPLLIVVRENTLDENERRLLSLAKPVAESKEYKVFSLDPADISAMVLRTYGIIKAEMDTMKLFPNGNYFTNDSALVMVNRDYNESGGKPFRGKGSFQALFHNHTAIFDSVIPVAGEYKLTFWFNRITKDVFPRTVIEVFAHDRTNQVQPFYLMTNASIQTKMIAGDWGLIEVPINVPCANAHVQITLWNDELRNDDLNEVDELLFIPAGKHFYQTSGDTIYRDNRRYFPVK